MTAKEWLEKFDVDLSKYHGNVGNEYGIAIENLTEVVGYFGETKSRK